MTSSETLGPQAGATLAVQMEVVVWTAIVGYPALYLSVFLGVRSKIDALDARMAARFARIDARFDQVEERFDALATRLDAHLDRDAE